MFKRKLTKMELLKKKLSKLVNKKRKKKINKQSNKRIITIENIKYI